MNLQEIKNEVEQLLIETGLSERALVWKSFNCPTLEHVRKEGKNVIIFIDNKEIVDETDLSK